MPYILSPETISAKMHMVKGEEEACWKIVIRSARICTRITGAAAGRPGRYARHPCSGRTAGKWSDCQYRDDRDRECIRCDGKAKGDVHYDRAPEMIEEDAGYHRDISLELAKIMRNLLPGKEIEKI